MLDVIAEDIAWFVVRLLLRCVSPIQLEVRALCCQWADSNRCERLTGPTGEPMKQYHAELIVINRRGAAVSVKGFLLVVNDKERYQPSGNILPLRLEAHETRRQPLVFALSDNEIPSAEGHFRLVAVPAAGRTSMVTGRFPVRSE